MKRFQAVVGESCFSQGFGPVLVGKFDSEGASVAGVFLVDLWCLGVKDAYVVEDLDDEEWERMVEQHGAAGKMEVIHPACAKKLIEGAADFAQALGFAAARDFRKARKLLNGIDATMCTREFVFGKNGKPCFVPGPDDDEERVERVLGMLRNKLGEEGFAYEPPAYDEDELDDDLESSRVMILEHFHDYEWNGVSGFYGYNGLMTALWICNWDYQAEQMEKQLDLIEGGLIDAKDADDRKLFHEEAEAFMELRGLDLELAQLGPEEESVNTVFDLDDETLDEAEVDSLDAMHEWALGFVRATELWPEAAGKLASTPELATEWRMLLAFARPKDVPESALVLGLQDKAADMVLERLAAAVLKMKSVLRVEDLEE